MDHETKAKIFKLLMEDEDLTHRTLTEIVKAVTEKVQTYQERKRPVSEALRLLFNDDEALRKLYEEHYL